MKTSSGDRGAILSVHLDSGVLRSRAELLRNAGYSVTSVCDVPDAKITLRQQEFDLLLLGHDLPSEDRHHLAAHAKAVQPSIRVLVLHASGNGPGSFADAAMDSRGSVEDVMSRIQELMKPREVWNGPVQEEGLSSLRSSIGR